jgi:protein-S-isoprenylcysteine O-methyltransferase Ste14
MVSRLIIRTGLFLAVMAALLFIPAGTADWPAAWIFLLGMAAWSTAMGAWLVRHDPGLLAERMAPLYQQGQKGWDKIHPLRGPAVGRVVGLYATRRRAVRLVARADVAVGPGRALAALMAYVVYLTFRENTFAAPVVKIQKERGHKVVSSGPYRHVRHPMYAGAIFFFLGTPLLLGSWYGLALAPFMMGMLAARAVMEERMLAAELEGYAEYAARVRYRLIPFVW